MREVQDANATPACAVHADRTAETTCARCGAFACPDCLEGSEWCSKCRNADRRPASALAVASAVVGAGSLLCGFLPGVVAVALAQWELRRIAFGTAPRAGLALARAGRVLGFTALALGALLLLALWR